MDITYLYINVVTKIFFLVYCCFVLPQTKAFLNYFIALCILKLLCTLLAVTTVLKPQLYQFSKNWRICCSSAHFRYAAYTILLLYCISKALFYLIHHIMLLLATTWISLCILYSSWYLFANFTFCGSL